MKSDSDSALEADYRVLHKNIGITPRRLESLSDSIYAVAMTLLVLDLSLPAHTGGSQLANDMQHLLPNFITYALSFMTLGVLWTSHLIQSHWIERLSRPYIWMKIVFLMFIVLIPFSTQILSAYGNDRLGVVMYGLNYLICVGFLLLLWTYATNEHRLVRRDLSAHVITWVKARMVIATALAIVALIVALISTRAGAAFFIVAQILMVLPTISIDKIVTRIGPRLQHDAGSVISSRKSQQ
ncbi:MAG: hypothetical protein JWO35_844 [Candidatus Saccharibacteria bacterium]|nr:hypothetical protein [Candidatus Saccharibacteria bacterium]